MSHFFDDLMIAKWEFQNRRDKALIISFYWDDSIFVVQKEKSLSGVRNFLIVFHDISLQRSLSSDKETNNINNDNHDSQTDGHLLPHY